MRLSDLLAGVSYEVASGTLDREVTMISTASSEVQPGELFIAVRPEDGGDDDVGAAIRAGAAAVITAAPVASSPSDVTIVRVADTSTALGQIVAAACDHPSRSLRVLAVTGTNGKSTVAWLLSQILTACSFRPGLIGTIENRYGEVREPASFTTPPACLLQPLFARMRDAGCTHVAMEATSHALALNRLAGTRIRVAGFTNLTRDHLDFHGTVEAYRDAKARLFRDFAEAACFAIDDPTGAELAARFTGPRLTVSSAGAAADLRARSLDCDWSGTTVELDGAYGAHQLRLPLIGRHNVENALVALGMALLDGTPLAAAIDALAGVEAAPGRCQVIAGPRQVVVDYAHTPDALRRLLTTLRPLCAGRLICVFGAGGDRDRGKRPLMGQEVAAIADVAVVTSDNPRSEDPRAIIDDILAGMTAPVVAITEPDRRVAISRAIAEAGPDDVVVIAGKGHETTQQVRGERFELDDRKVARAVLEAVEAAEITAPWRSPGAAP